MDIKVVKAVVLKILGKAGFKKDAEGKFSLSDEEKQKLAGLWGEEFPELFEQSLSQEEGEGEHSAEEMIAALKAHSAKMVGASVTALQAELNSVKNKNKTLEQLVETMSGASEEVPAAVVPGTGAVPTGRRAKKAFKVNANNPLYKAALDYIDTGNPNVYAGTTIDVTDLRSEFGTYLSQNGNNLEIKKKLFTGFTSSKYFTWVRAITEYRAIRALITSVVQQFTPKWTPGGKAAFKPMVIKNYRHKINFPIIPAEVVDSYMLKLYEEDKAPDQMPLTLYIWNELLQPAILQDIEMRMIYKGKFIDHSGTQNTNSPATPPEDSMDGIETVIVEAKAAGNTGMHFFRPNSNFDFQVEADAGNWEGILKFVSDYVAWLSPWYKTTKMNLFLSPDWLRIYQVAYKEVWGKNSGQDGDFGTLRVDFSNQMLAAPDGMYNSKIMYCTPLQNQIALRHINEVPNIINDVQVHDYEVRLYGEFWMGVGFLYPNGVFAYCPNGYDPKSEVASILGAFDSYQEDMNIGDGEPDSSASGI